MTLAEHEAPGANDPEQLVVSRVNGVDPALTIVKLTLAVAEVLVTVTPSVGVWPTTTLPKLRLLGLIARFAAVGAAHAGAAAIVPSSRLEMTAPFAVFIVPLARSDANLREARVEGTTSIGISILKRGSDCTNTTHVASDLRRHAASGNSR